tara:strand:- start:2830 stop:2964 length:135 start_codon:yes stop_codon:yes gene_type:complete
MNYKQFVLDNIKFILDGDMTQLRSIALVMAVDLTLTYVVWSYIE